MHDNSATKDLVLEHVRSFSTISDTHCLKIIQFTTGHSPVAYLPVKATNFDPYNKHTSYPLSNTYHLKCVSPYNGEYKWTGAIKQIL